MLLHLRGSVEPSSCVLGKRMPSGVALSISISDWSREVAARSGVSIGRSVRVVGRRDKHLGPRREVAQVEIVVSPADDWTVVVELDDLKRLQMERNDWVTAVILGVLDVFMTRPAVPINRARLALVDAVLDPLHSSHQAFRMAGRDAGEKALIELNAE